MQELIRRLGDYDHVSVRARRGHLVVMITGDDDGPVARLTPLGGGLYGLSVYHHAGRWEPMPFSGDLDAMANTVTTVLAPYLERVDFSRTISRSDH
jgi:hypothetical protein